MKDTANWQADHTDKKLKDFDQKHGIGQKMSHWDEKIGFSRASNWITSKVNRMEKDTKQKLSNKYHARKNPQYNEVKNNEVDSNQ